MNSNYVYKIALLSISCVCVKLSLKNSVFVHVKQYRMVYNQWKHSSHDCCINRSMATLNAFDVIIGSKFIDRSQSILNCYLGFCGINSEDYWNVTWMLYDAASHMEFTLTISWLLKQQWIYAHNTLLTLIASKQADKQICTNKCNIFLLSLKHDINCIPGIIIHSPIAAWNHNNIHI